MPIEISFSHLSHINSGPEQSISLEVPRMLSKRPLSHSIRQEPVCVPPTQGCERARDPQVLLIEPRGM